MNHFSKASLFMLGKLKYFHKFVMISLIMIIVLMVLIGQLAFQSLALIHFSKNELVGLEYLSPLMKVTHSIQQYRNVELNYLLDEKNWADKLARAQKEVDTAVAEMEKTDNKLGLELKSTQDWDELKSEWELIKQSRVIDPNKSNFDNATMLINNLGNLINHVCDTSNLTLDPEIISYYLGDTYCTKLPTFITELTIIRDISTKAFKTHALNQDEHKELIINENLLNNFNKLAIKDNLDKVTYYLEDVNKNESISNNTVNTLVSETTNIMSLLDSSLLAEPPNMNATIQPTRFTNLLSVATTLSNQVQTVLKDSLEMRIKKIYKRFSIDVIISILALLLMAYLLIGIYHSIVKNSRKLLHHAKKMEEGDFHSIINIQTQDEIAKAATHLDSMRHAFFLISQEINTVLDKVISGKDLHARVNIKSEGSFEKLENNINAIAKLVESMVKHTSKLVEIEQQSHTKSTIASLAKNTEKTSELVTHGTETLASFQDDFQPHYKQINDLLKELKTYYREEHESLKGDIHTLEDVVLQMRILSLNLASFVEKIKTAAHRDSLIEFATEIRNLAERIFSISHMIKSVESITDKQRSISSKLIDSVNTCHTSWSKSINKLSTYFKDLLTNVSHQKETVEKLEETQKQLHQQTENVKQQIPHPKKTAEKK